VRHQDDLHGIEVTQFPVEVGLASQIGECLSPVFRDKAGRELQESPDLLTGAER
jgi:hypothetical protein